jgi:hypothetical protein
MGGVLLFKKLMFSMAKEMDKDRKKRYQKQEKRQYYITQCTSHADRINEIVTNCQDSSLSLAESIEDDKVLAIEKVEVLKNIIKNIDLSIEMIKNNNDLFDLPSNAKAPYKRSIENIITGLGYLRKCYEVNLEMQKDVALVQSGDITPEEFEVLQEKLEGYQNNPPASYQEKYLTYRKMQIDSYKTTLDIINNS